MLLAYRQVILAKQSGLEAMKGQMSAINAPE